MDEEKINKLADFSREHPGVDVTPLLSPELAPEPSRGRVYFISAFFPPFGLIYAVKYLLFDNDTAAKRRLGWLALVITIIAVLIVLGGFYVVGRQLQSQLPASQDPSDFLKDYKDLLQ